MITHHPDFELLFDYASGALSEPMALSIAVHASTCAQCRKQLQKLEEVGGTLLEEATNDAVTPHDLEAMMARLDEPALETKTEAAPPLPPAFDETTARIVPKPLRDYLPESLKNLNWRHIGSKVSQFNLDIDVAGYKVSLMRFKAGAPMPIHTHKGNEVTLVLAGGYSDGGRHFERGDYDMKDPSHTHQPVVDEGEDCIALVVMDAPVILAGPFSRFLNPFIKL